MRVSVTFRNCDSSDETRKYVETRLKKIEKYADGPMEVNVVLTVAKFRNIVDVVVAGNGLKAAAKEEQDDMFSAIDLVSDKIEKQLKKFRERQRERKGGETLATMAASKESAVMTEAADSGAIHVEKMDPKPMSVQEAVEQLQVRGDDFLLFFNDQTRNVNCIYWREDGILGLIEP